MKARKRKANINIAPNFKGYDPKLFTEVLTRRNERKLIRTGNDSDSKSVATGRIAEQREKKHSVFEDEIQKQIIVRHPHLQCSGHKKAACLKGLEGDCSGQ